MTIANDNPVTETERFVLFWRGWPSQWVKSSFTLGGIEYGCCEQFMMVEKAVIFGDAETAAQILATSSPKMQKALGRKVRNFDPVVWNDVCQGVVYTANLAKFGQDPNLAKLLLATGEKTIVEASPVDSIWGIGLAANDPRAIDPRQWQGTNWLGIALMRVRKTLRARKEQVEAHLDAELQMQLDIRRTLPGAEKY